MSDETPLLGLPLILPAQAQKHVTHNEGLALLDTLVQPAVITFGSNTPPATPAEGDRHVTGSAPTGLWAGQAGKLALYEGAVWRFLAPKEGWTVQIPSQQTMAVYESGIWRLPGTRPMTTSQLGIGTSSDAFNVLNVAGPATLLSHAGTGGHQVKINKAASGDTASVLLQTGFSGRAELGTIGNDSFSIKVSADGTTFADAIVIPVADASLSAPGGVMLPDGSAATPGLRFAADTDTGLHRPGTNTLGLVTAGVVRASISDTAMQIDLPVTGTAVTQSATDATSGRLLKVSDFGLGGITLDVSAGAASLPTRFARFDADANTPDGTRWHGMHIQRATSDGQGAQVAIRETGASVMAVRNRGPGTPGTWSAWNLLYGRTNILATVSQTSGVPTGGLIETGSSANGTWRRFACGLQICWRENLSATNVSTANGSLFRSASVTWTFPAAFIAAPVVTGQADPVDMWMTGALPTTTTVALRLYSPTTVAAATAFRAVATGRWF